jgi:hypothetical protein
MTTSEQEQRILADLESQFDPPDRFGIRIAVLTTMFGLGVALVVAGLRTIEPMPVVLLVTCGGCFLMAVAVRTTTQLVRGHRATHSRGDRPALGGWPS